MFRSDFKKCHLFFVSLMTLSTASAQVFDAYEQKIFQKGEQVLPYRMLKPMGDTAATYPLIIFLHGAFEKGTDNQAPLNIGGRFFLRDSIRKNYPAYIVFPQCPAEDSWAYFENTIDLETGLAKDWVFPFKEKPTDITGLVKAWLDVFLATGKVDASRVYVMGLSQGGMGVLDMLARYPDIFAAGISICGAGNPETSKLFASKSSLWLLHGSADKVVPAFFSRQYQRRLKKAESDVRYTEYAGVGHDSWGNAFREPDLMAWLFSKSKRNR